MSRVVCDVAGSAATPNDAVTWAPFDGRPQSFSLLRRHRQPALRQDDHQFFPTVTACNVTFAQLRQNERRSVPKHGVTFGMARETGPN